MRIKFLWTTLIAISAGATQGGRDVGNGGDGILCKAGDRFTVELVDYFEGKTRYHHKLHELSGTAQEIIKARLGFLSQFSPNRARIYSTWAEEFWESAEFVTGYNLEDIPDTDLLLTPKECELKQLAIHQEPNELNSHRYIVNKDLWDLMDENQKAGLVLHELIFREARLYGHTHSKYARFLNSFISQLNEGIQWNFQTDFFKVLVKAHFGEAELLIPQKDNKFVSVPFLLSNRFTSNDTRFSHYEWMNNDKEVVFLKPTGENPIYFEMQNGELISYSGKLRSFQLLLEENKIRMAITIPKKFHYSDGQVREYDGQTFFQNKSGKFETELRVEHLYDFFDYNKDSFAGRQGHFSYNWYDKVSQSDGKFSFDFKGLVKAVGIFDTKYYSPDQASINCWYVQSSSQPPHRYCRMSLPTTEGAMLEIGGKMYRCHGKYIDTWWNFDSNRQIKPYWKEDPTGGSRCTEIK